MIGPNITKEELKRAVSITLERRQVKQIRQAREKNLLNNGFSEWVRNEWDQWAEQNLSNNHTSRVNNRRQEQ